MNETSFNRNYFIFALMFIVLSFFVMQGFVFGMIGGALTALSVWPIFEKICSKKYKWLKYNIGDNAFIFATTFSLIFIIPLCYGIFEIYNLYSVGSTYITENTSHGVLKIPDIVKYLPMKDKIIILWDENVAHSKSLVEVLNKITGGKFFEISSHMLSNIVSKLTTVFVMIISFYFMLKHGEYVKNNYRNIFTYWIGDKSVHQIENGVESLRGTINGVVLVGIVEGVILSIPLVISGFPSGFVIALAAGILGVIPMLMPLLILPCLGYMYLSGDTTWAIVGAIDLAVVWFVFENAVKPQVIGKKVKINTFIILGSMIGGMQLLGFLGLFVGPAIVSMAIGTMKELFVNQVEEFQRKKEKIVKKED